MPKGWIGFDIGSVSTKAVCIDKDKKVIGKVYLRNMGVIETLKQSLKELKEQVGNVEICGVCTTGSGKELNGLLIGSDLYKTEINAHCKAASTFYPSARTIIDIGGEDSKLIILENEEWTSYKTIWSGYKTNDVCLKENTDITLNNFTSKPIEDIEIGEKILTHKGRFKQVNNIYKNKYEGKIINITLSNLRNLEITPEHPILSLKRENIKCYISKSRNQIIICRPDRNIEWCKKHRCKKGEEMSFEPKFIKANELTKGDLIAIPLPSEVIDTDYIEYSKIKGKRLKFENPEKKLNRLNLNLDVLRFLGYYLAEGYILYNKSRKNKKIKYPSGICFVFHSKEDEYINDIFEIASKNFPNFTIKCNKNLEKHTASVILYSKSLAKYVLYLCGSKADKKIMSRELMFLKPELQLEILKGLFRGDACFINKLKNKRMERRYNLTTISKQLAYQVQWILLRNKIKCSFHKDNQKTKGNHTIYNIGINCLEINKLNDNLFYIDTKEINKTHSYSFIYSNWLFSPIKKISEDNYNGYVYNLEIEDDNSYVANSLAVHNCGAGTGATLDAISSYLNVPIEDVGNLALQSKNVTNFSSKCGLICLSGVKNERNRGADVKDLLMGSCEALVNCYMRIVGNLTLKPDFIFQGATAQNKALVKALERELKHKVIVPKYCSVMGAIGAAILAMNVKQTNWKGWNIIDKDIVLKNFVCHDCENNCKVTQLFLESKFLGGIGSWCGKWNSKQKISL